jgi:hypothetical protein
MPQCAFMRGARVHAVAAPEESAVWLLGEQRWSRPSNGTS